MIFSYKTLKKLYTHYQIFFRFETITNTIPYYTHIQPLGCLGAVNSWPPDWFVRPSWIWEHWVPEV